MEPPAVVKKLSSSPSMIAVVPAIREMIRDTAEFPNVRELISKGGYPMTHAERVRLWDAINDYAKSCGGDTSSENIKTDRCFAVSAVETVVREIISRVRRQEAEDIVAAVLT